MRVEEGQTVQVIAPPCKSNPTSPAVKYERSQRADNSDLCSKVKKKRKMRDGISENLLRKITSYFIRCWMSPGAPAERTCPFHQRGRSMRKKFRIHRAKLKIRSRNMIYPRLKAI